MSSKKWQIAASKGVKKIDSLFGPPKKKNNENTPTSTQKAKIDDEPQKMVCIIYLIY